MWGLLASLFMGLMGMAQSSSAQSEQQELSQEQWEMTQKEKQAKYESDIATYEYNIGATGEDIEYMKGQKEYALGEWGRQTEEYNRAQRETYGASGAVVGVGTPLEEMEKQAQHQELMAGQLSEKFEKTITGLEEQKSYLEEQKGKTESLVEELWPTEEEVVEEEEETSKPEVGGACEAGQTMTTGAGGNIQEWYCSGGHWVKRSGGNQ